MLGPVAQANRHEAILDILGAEIADGTLAPGATLTLAALEDRFDASRTVVREVMRALEGLGMVRSGRRVGIVVRPPEAWDVYDRRLIRWRLAGPGRDTELARLTELRVAVEPLAAALAARRADDAARSHLLDLAARLRTLGEAGELEEFLAVDVAFHRALLGAGGNPYFAALGDVVAEVLAGRTHLGLMPRRPRPVALDAHDAVARAVHDGDPAAAEDALRTIVGEVREALERADP